MKHLWVAKKVKQRDKRRLERREEQQQHVTGGFPCWRNHSRTIIAFPSLLCVIVVRKVMKRRIHTYQVIERMELLGLLKCEVIFYNKDLKLHLYPRKCKNSDR